MTLWKKNNKIRIPPEIQVSWKVRNDIKRKNPLWKSWNRDFKSPIFENVLYYGKNDTTANKGIFHVYILSHIMRYNILNNSISSRYLKTLKNLPYRFIVELMVQLAKHPRFSFRNYKLHILPFLRSLYSGFIFMVHYHS